MAEYLTLHGNSKNLKDVRFGRLVALGAIRREADKSGRSLVVWECLCDCGKTIETRSCNLLSGDTKSCGCLKIDDIVQRSTKHGQAPRSGVSDEYNIWAGMIARCDNPEMGNYRWYGGRGITVCERWYVFANFFADVGSRPSKDHSIERIDVNGHYEPSNVKWATTMEQGANMRSNRMITAFGETKHMQEWCRAFGLKQGTLWDRLDRGWDVERAISGPTK